MRSFSSFLSVFALLVALFQASVLAAPIKVDKRTFYVPASALDSNTVLNWLADKGASYADPSKLVFYTSTNGGGSDMAANFVRANPGYKSFWELYGDDFEADFKISADDVPYEGAQAMSKAMAQYASGTTRVFGASNAASDSIWKEIELPALKGSGKIDTLVSMSDGAVAIDDTIGALAIDGAEAAIADGAVADLLSDFLLAILL